jgi:hypothetical protein
MVESMLATELKTGKYSLDTFLSQARVTSVPYHLCSCGGRQQRAKHVFIFCHGYTGASHELRDEQGCLPNFKIYLGQLKDNE